MTDEDTTVDGDDVTPNSQKSIPTPKISIIKSAALPVFLLSFIITSPSLIYLAKDLSIDSMLMYNTLSRLIITFVILLFFATKYPVIYNLFSTAAEWVKTSKLPSSKDQTIADLRRRAGRHKISAGINLALITAILAASGMFMIFAGNIVSIDQGQIFTSARIKESLEQEIKKESDYTNDIRSTINNFLAIHSDNTKNVISVLGNLDVPTTASANEDTINGKIVSTPAGTRELDTRINLPTFRVS